LKKNKLNVGTRGSLLALVQTDAVLKILTHHLPDSTFEKKIIHTQGDLDLTSAFQDMQTRSVFTKELDDALFDGRIDMAVHSLKDLASSDLPGLCLAWVGLKEDVRDVWISNSGARLDQLSEGAKVGSSSIRRQTLLKNYMPQVFVEGLRGNLSKRFEKLQQGTLAGMLISAAGLHRLGWQNRITQYLDPTYFVPAAGQGLVGVVIRERDRALYCHLQVLQDPQLWQLASLQRLFMKKMNGGCRVPMGVWIDASDPVTWTFHAYLASPDAKTVLRHHLSVDPAHADPAMHAFINEFDNMGAHSILAHIRP